MSKGGGAGRGRAGRGSAASAGGFRLLIAFALIGALLSPAAVAQETAAEPPAVSAEQADELIRTLEDPAAREKLIQQLRALQAAQAQAAPPEEAEGFGAELLTGLSEQVDRMGNTVGRAVEKLPGLPRLIGTGLERLGEPAVRQRWVGGLVDFAIMLAAGLVAQWLAARLLARPRRSLMNNGGESLWLRIPFIFGRTLLDLVPIAAFAAVAYAVLPLTEPRPAARLVTLAFINAYAVVGAVMVLSRILLAPGLPGLRIVALSDESANYAEIWVWRLSVVAVYGYVLVEALLLLGLPRGGYEILLRLLGLVVTAMVVVVILQNRAAVAGWLRGGETEGRFARLRGRFADIWHILAIAYAVAVFFVSSLSIPGGFAFLLRATLLSIVVLLLARLVIAAERGAVVRGFRLGAELKSRFPNLEERANRYLPALQRVIEALIALIAVLALLEVWGIDSFGWLKTGWGRRILGSGLAIAIILAGAVALSELVGFLIERFLSRAQTGGTPVARSARIRTLLPLLRNAFRVTLAVLVVLVVLAELGVNIAPLLAAAGVAGLAIGFGAQTLVQDVITGIFILAEDSISIGDVVDVGGHSGVVEAMTIRTLRLRDTAGTVHTVPFSSVKTIQNLTRDFSYAVFDLGIAYREDVDEVVEVLKEVGADLRADEKFSPQILAPIEVFGLDSFGASAVVIKARIMTRPLQQWSIAREFNLRLKRAFDEKGIEMPFPHQTIYFGEDRQGKAPPVRVRVESADSDSPRRHRDTEEGSKVQ